MTWMLIAVAALSACSSVRPGAAVVVDGEPIAMSEVSQAAEIYCSAQSGSGQDVDSAQIRQEVAMRLAVGAIADDVVQTRALNVDESLVEIPERDRKQIRARFGARADEAIDVVTQQQRLFAQMVAIGADETGQTPNADILQNLAGVGNTYVNEQLAARDVKFAPSLGIADDGQRALPGRLSVPAADVDRLTSAKLPASVGCRAS